MAQPQGARRLGCCTQTPRMAEMLHWARSLPGCSVPGHGIYRTCLGGKMGNKKVAEMGVFQDFSCQHRPNCGEVLHLLLKQRAYREVLIKVQTLNGQISAIC